ncbi:hypothetical protein QVD17_24360 [Tagetes erecta]|uniref:Uncharacterized protein n=1 Tax=Tagetes erecta TaxID=13708 RepID=A0AAD8NUI8_TARER|nr:hypothetical protein QVD17_24360 [Tagetes erecta]
MTSTDMRQWLQSRNYPYKTLKRLKKIVVSFQKSEKMHNRMFFLDYNNPQYFELTKRFKVLEPKEIPLMALPEDAHKKRKEMIVMFPSEVKAYHIPMDVRELWHKSATAGDIVRSLLSKGQSVADLLDSMILPVQDLKELHKLRLINHTRAKHGDKCAMLLDAGISRMPKFLEFRGQQEDKLYLDSKKKKQTKLILRDMYLEEFSDEYFDKVTNPGLKVFDGSQKTKPILKFFYHEETYKLKLVRNLDDWDQDMITLFSTFELNLLHPSYIDHLRNHKMEKIKDPVAEADRRLFKIMVEVIGAATEKIRLRKALLNATL